jgi:hypothetical protein
MNKWVFVQYGGDPDFLPSVSGRVKITVKSLTSAAMARPFFRFAHRGAR